MPQHEIPTPSAGLRQPGVRLRNKSNDIIRASMVVPAGAELETDEYVAAQLLRDASFEVVAASSLAGPDVADEGPEGAAPPAAPPVPGPVEETGGGAARRRSGRRG